MSNSRRIPRKRVKASTLVELLFTMIISGVIFLLIFDGLDVIKRFSFIVNNRISTNQSVLYSHQFMEYLVENADSITRSGNKILYYQQGIACDSITIDDDFFILNSIGMTDTLFAGYIKYRTSSSIKRSNHVDSLFICCVVNTKDTIWLEYTLSNNHYDYLNSDDNYEHSW